MSSIVVSGDTSGAITIAAPAVSGTNTLTLPAATGTFTTNKTVGSVLQVLQTAKVDVFSTTSTTLTDITGLSVAITPSASTNKILINVQVYTGNNSAGDSCYFSLFRDSTQIGGGTASSNRPSGFSAALCASTAGAYFAGGQFLDSPATTSAVTYKLQMRVSGGTGRVGATGDDNDTANRPRFASTITVTEVVA
jgi:hypothetical protein